MIWAQALVIVWLAGIAFASGCMVGMHLDEARSFTRASTRRLYWGFATLDALTCAVCSGVALYVATL